MNKILAFLIAGMTMAACALALAGCGQTPAAPSPARATSILTATQTPSPTATVRAGPPSPAAQALAPTPALVPNSQYFSIVADPKASGWVQEGESRATLGDPNLHSGVYKGRTFRTLVYFDLSSLPLGTKILYAEVKLTGLSRDYLGAEGEWTLRALPQDLVNGWANRLAADYQGKTTGDIAKLTPKDLSVGQENQFVFPQAQLSLLEQALSTGAIAFRLDGPTGNSGSLFTWDAGGPDPKVGAHPVLNVMAVPGQFVVITNTPTPANLGTSAAQIQTIAAQVAREGTPTPFPRNYQTATPVVVVTPRPTAANSETAAAEAAYATAIAITTGTFTPTPLNWVTATPFVPTSTPLPTWTPLFVPEGALTPFGTPTPLPGLDQLLQTPVPPEFRGNLLIVSNRFGGRRPLLISPSGQMLQTLTGFDFYNAAFARESLAPERTRRVTYVTDNAGIQQIAVQDLRSGQIGQITHLVRGLAYDAVWSPDGRRIAYVSTETNIAEVWVMNADGSGARQATHSNINTIFNQRPTWSPDSSRIAFKSNRDTGHFQIWVMNADGGALQNLSASPYDDLDPIWVK